MIFAKAALALLTALAAANCHAAPSAPEAPAFRQSCGASLARPTHPQLRWNCVDRGYQSFDELYAALKRRMKSGWQVPDPGSMFDRPGVQEVFWDCRWDGKCGYWVRHAKGLMFFQRLLSSELNTINEWLGVGVTTFCDGTREECDGLERVAARWFPAQVDLADSELGVPPIEIDPPDGEPLE